MQTQSPIASAIRA